MLFKISSLMIITFISVTYSKFNLHIPVDDGICENWSNFGEPGAENCSKIGKVFQCFGEAPSMQDLSFYTLKKIDEVIFCGWPNITFNPQTTLRAFPRIQMLRIEHSNLTHILYDFPDMHSLEIINISWTNLAYTRPNLFKNLHNLKYLDLRWNKLDHMDSPLILPPPFEELYLAGNPWNCTNNLTWLLTSPKGEFIADRDILLCADYKYTSRHLLSVMQFKINLQSECSSHDEIRNCTCTMHYIRPSDDGTSLTPIYAVNCSNLHLFNFPSYLPENTTIFHATGNQISDVRSLRNNAVYRAVIDVYLDYNRIESIDVLEAGFWLHNFRVLSLKGNNLAKLPVYALDNALEKNYQASKLYLSLNPWICDCQFTMRFRELLMKYNTIIHDSNNITCKYKKGANSRMTPVLTLQRTDVCKLPTEHKIQPIDLLNGFLAFLIVFILGKLAYDYYHYRKAGRLPWIVTKIP